ncbi:unnamed protein product [Schistocephalus solidus]|uniref:Four helix bundle protein n=1 Tax=Schistocephalus solidus TaxID=70667 RepID=A0A183SW86_SCHSO|nr:unnamed protein product [Schistocephalus solidus]
MGREVVKLFIKQMRRVLIDDCRRRLQKYKAVIEQNKREYARVLGESITEDLGQTVSMLGSRIHEHKLAVRRGDCLSQVAAHTYETGHEFNFAASKIVAHVRCKTSRESLEAWASVENSVRRFIDLAPAYRALRSHLRTGTTGV